MKMIVPAVLCAVLAAPAVLAQDAPAPMHADAVPAAAPVASAPVQAQLSTAAPVMAVARPTLASTGSMLPENTEIWMSPNSEVNSKTLKQGDKFDMSVTRDVMLGDYIVIPRGTPGKGQIAYRTGKGAFGKSAKIEIDLVDVTLNGRDVPVKGHYRIEGQGNTGATVGAVVAVGVLGAFVTGHSAVIAQGTEFKANMTSGLPVAIAAAPTPAVVPAATAAPAAAAANPVKATPSL